MKCINEWEWKWKWKWIEVGIKLEYVDHSRVTQSQADPLVGTGSCHCDLSLLE